MRKISYNILLIFIFFSLFSCEKIDELQKKSTEKRYGKSSLETRLPEWQESVKQYEKEIEKKISAGSNAAKLYRKIGESFGQMESYPLCIENLKRAIELGGVQDEVFYSLGLCQGSHARTHNWAYDLTKEAEETFLKVLNINPNFSRAVFQLGLIYFYGFSRHNRYQILSEEISVSESQFRKKGIELMKKYQTTDRHDDKSYFALAGMYIITGETRLAKEQMLELIQVIKSQNYKNFEKSPAYLKAQQNLKILSQGN